MTAFTPTLISAPEAELIRALGVIGAAGATAGGIRVLGAHLEGPFLSPAWPGAHDPAHLRAPDRALLDRLLAAGPVALMTLAPELDGATALLDALGDRALIGHTDADAATCTEAFARGARGLTHALNAHRRFAARDPGPAGAALAHDDALVCAIADGVHVAPEALGVLWRAAGRRLCLVSDAVAVGHGRARAVGGRRPAGRRDAGGVGRRARRLRAHARRLRRAGGAGAARRVDRARRAWPAAPTSGAWPSAPRPTWSSSTTTCAWCARSSAGVNVSAP